MILFKRIYLKLYLSEDERREYWTQYWARQVEIDKFNAPRRRAIADLFPLTQEQKEQIDELFLTNYGEKVDYVWHQNYAAHAGRFDYKFMPELLFIPEFERFQNLNKAANRMMSDKNFLPIIAKAAGIQMPRTVLSCTNGILRDSENRIVTSNQGEEILQSYPVFFVKPSVDSCSGQGCRLKRENDDCKVRNGRLILGKSNADSAEYAHDYVCQQVVKTHESVAVLHPESVNTFRVITYLWEDAIETMPVILRIGRGNSNVDNAHAGGMFIAINADGSLGNHAVTEFNDQYKVHPDSGIVFKDHIIVSYDKMINAAKRMHEMVPQIGVVNWDFTIGTDGEPILIEANIEGGSIWLPQMAHGVGAFAGRTERVLQWLRFMKKTKPEERSRYIGGKIE